MAFLFLTSSQQIIPLPTMTLQNTANYQPTIAASPTAQSTMVTWQQTNNVQELEQGQDHVHQTVLQLDQKIGNEPAKGMDLAHLLHQDPSHFLAHVNVKGTVHLHLHLPAGHLDLGLAHHLHRHPGQGHHHHTHQGQIFRKIKWPESCRDRERK